MAAPLAKPRATDVDENLVEPGVELLPFAEVGQAAPGSNRGFLDGVLGFGRVSEEVAGQAVGAG